MRMTRGQVPSQYYLALFIKAFNSFASGNPLLVLKLLETESFPQILKPKK